MNTTELNDELDSLRELAVERALRCTHTDWRCKQLMMLAQKLGLARDAEVRDEIKAVVLRLGKLALRAADLPGDFPIDGCDQELISSIVIAGTRLQ